MPKSPLLVLSILCLIAGAPAAPPADSLPPLSGATAKNIGELWGTYDPAKEPLDVKVIHQWEANGVTTQMLVYTVGRFKGKPTLMGAYYARPTRPAGKLPALLHLHGGGQRAQRQTVEAAAANGYAAISINWGGKLMDDQKPEDPGTDWGALDATQTTHNSHFASLEPDAKTLDAIKSPRNNNWFLIVIAARRALTFLQQQPEVDPDRLGVEGHSMGGRLTVMTAGIDRRVKAAVPSCGGTGDASADHRARPGAAFRPANPEPLYYATIDELQYLGLVECPILYIGPHNDFNANLDILFDNWSRSVPSKVVRFSISPHFNHRHVPESAFAAVHFFDVSLKGKGKLPNTPKLDCVLKTDDQVPLAFLAPDRPDDVVRVEIFYSVDPHALTRFWRRADAKRDGTDWLAPCPIISTDLPLHLIANVYYKLPAKLAGPPWQSQSPETFLVSSHAVYVPPATLRKEEVKATQSPDRLIEADFSTWGDWYQLEPRNVDHRQAWTRKIKDPAWRGPDGARLAIDVLDPAGGKLAMMFEMNSWNAFASVNKGTYFADKPIAKSNDWQTIEFSLADLKPVDQKSPGSPASWQFMTELAIVAHVRSGGGANQQILAGSPWPASRKFRNLRWIGGAYPRQVLLPGAKISEEEFRRTFQAEIDKSVQQEKRDAAQPR